MMVRRKLGVHLPTLIDDINHTVNSINYSQVRDIKNPINAVHIATDNEAKRAGKAIGNVIRPLVEQSP